jgi:hypothetical protein
MLLEFSLTKEDLFNFNYHTGWAAPEKKKFRISFYLKTIGWAFAGVLLVLSVTRQFGLASILFSCCIAVIVGLISAYFSISHRYKNSLEKFVSQPENQSFFNRATLNITDAGITSQDDISEAKYNWNAITKKTETQDYIYLYLNTAQAIVIPKRILAEEEKQELNTILSRNLSLSAELTAKAFS